jgi:hypothetical protein
MPDRTLTVPVAGEPHQATRADSGTGTATAGAIVVVIPNNMTNDDVERGLAVAMDVARRDPSRINGI